MDPFSLLGTVSGILGGGGMFGDQSGGLNASTPEQVTISPQSTAGGGAFIVGGQNNAGVLLIGLLVLAWLLLRR